MAKRKAEELLVIVKTYDFILWFCNHTGKFPRNHRFVLGERIERHLYDLLETRVGAKNRKRITAERDGDNVLITLRRDADLSAPWSGSATN